MGYGRSRILSLVILVLCGYLLVNLLFVPDYVFTSPPTIVDENITLVLSNRLSSSNTSWQSSVPYHDLPTNDSSQLINVTNFKFLINVHCSESMYIVCVHSAPGNHLRRQLVRETWGAHVHLYFMLAETSPDEQKLIDAESRQYHDIVQGRFHDSYANLTYKHTMLFKWVVYHCPSVHYVLKCDDDMFVNVVMLNDFLTNSLSPYGIKNLLMCPTVWYHDVAQRGYRSKWRVSYKEYPEHYYPPYCRGPILLYSPDMMFKLYQTLQKEQKYFWIDDVFITGIVFSHLNLTHSDFNWWLGDGKSLIKVGYYEDLLKYDPSKNLFVFVTNPQKTFASKIFHSLNNATFVPQNNSISSKEELFDHESLSSF